MFSLTPARLTRENTNFDRVFKDLFGEGLIPEQKARGFSPVIDLSESEEAYLVRAELPGVSADDIEIDHEKDILTIRGEKKAVETKEENGTRWVESRHGAFRRSVRLGLPVDVEKVDARLENGVLFVTVPKAEQAKPRKITVRAEK